METQMACPFLIHIPTHKIKEKIVTNHAKWKCPMAIAGDWDIEGPKATSPENMKSLDYPFPTCCLLINPFCLLSDHHYQANIAQSTGFFEENWNSSLFHEENWNPCRMLFGFWQELSHYDTLWSVLLVVSILFI